MLLKQSRRLLLRRGSQLAENCRFFPFRRNAVHWDRDIAGVGRGVGVGWVDTWCIGQVEGEVRHGKGKGHFLWGFCPSGPQQGQQPLSDESQCKPYGKPSCSMVAYKADNTAAAVVTTASYSTWHREQGTNQDFFAILNALDEAV